MQIHSLIFTLETDLPKLRELVVHIDENGHSKLTRHAHPSKTMLDVEAGHTVVNRGKQFVVTAVRLFCTSLCKGEYAEVVSWREWQAHLAYSKWRFLFALLAGLRQTVESCAGYPVPWSLPTARGFHLRNDCHHKLRPVSEMDDDEFSSPRTDI